MWNVNPITSLGQSDAIYIIHNYVMLNEVVV